MDIESRGRMLPQQIRLQIISLDRQILTEQTPKSSSGVSLLFFVMIMEETQTQHWLILNPEKVNVCCVVGAQAVICGKQQNVIQLIKG